MVAPPSTVGASTVIATATPSSAPPTATRKSRPLRRKTSHSVIERRRREKINEGLITLQHTVPACRDELRALLLSKAQSNKRNARRPLSEVEAEVEATLREKVDTQMVLEKLCIISHTVDYVEELHQKIAAYRRLCRCSPPLETAVGAPRSIAHSQAHAEAAVEDDEEEEEIEATGGSTRSSPTSDASVHVTRKRHASFSEIIPEVTTAEDLEAVSHCTACIIGRAKRQRHWGSNNPLELSKALPSFAPPLPPHRHKRSASLSQSGHGHASGAILPAPRRQPARKASASLAVPLRSTRKDSVSSTEALDDTKQIAGALALPTLAQDDGADDGDDSDSELALNDWHEGQHHPASALHDSRPHSHDHHHQHHHYPRHHHVDPDPLRLRLLRLGPTQDDKRIAVAHPPHLPIARPDLLYTSEGRSSSS